MRLLPGHTLASNPLSFIDRCKVAGWTAIPFSLFLLLPSWWTFVIVLPLSAVIWFFVHSRYFVRGGYGYRVVGPDGQDTGGTVMRG